MKDVNIIYSLVIIRALFEIQYMIFELRAKGKKLELLEKLNPENP